MLLWWLACSQQSIDVSDSIDTSSISVPWSSDETGPYDAGLYSFSFINSDQRELYVDVWYPAQKEEVATRALYEPFSFKGKAYRDAPIARKDTKLIVFSHGLLSIRFQNFSLCEHLAQHGYTVIAPDHPGTTIFDLGEDIIAESVFVRPNDIQTTVDQIWEKNQDEGDFLHGLLGSDQYLAIGHSLGSHTVMAVAGAAYDYEGFMVYCAEHPNDRSCKIASNISEEEIQSYPDNDTRAYAAIAMSPGFWYTFGEGLAQLRRPMFVTGLLDQVLEYDAEAQPTLDLSSNGSELHFSKTGHYGFTEMCNIIPAFSDECTDTSGDFTEPAILLEALNNFTLAHIRGNLENDEGAQEWLKDHGWSDDVLEYRP